MIRSFAELQTEVIWSGRRGCTPPSVIQAVGAACCVAEPSESARRSQSSELEAFWSSVATSIFLDRRQGGNAFAITAQSSPSSLEERVVQ